MLKADALSLPISLNSNLYLQFEASQLTEFDCTFIDIYMMTQKFSLISKIIQEKVLAP